MVDDKAVNEAIESFRDHRMGPDDLYDALVAAGMSPEEASESVQAEMDE